MDSSPVCETQSFLNAINAYASQFNPKPVRPIEITKIIRTLKPRKVMQKGWNN